MRSPILLVLAVALILAGCATPDADTTTTPPTGTTTPTPIGNATPLEVKKTTFDFTTLGTPAGGASSVAVEIPEGYANLNFTVRFSPSTAAPVGLASGITVKIGTLVCALPDGPVTGPLNCPKTGPATAGPAKIEASGNGPVVASVTLMVE